MKKLVKLLSLLVVACMIFSACAPSIGDVSNNIVDNTANNTVADTAITDIENADTAESASSSNANKPSSLSQSSAVPEAGTYNEGVALVKYDSEITDNMLSQLNLVSAKRLYSGSSWYAVELVQDTDTIDTVTYLRELNCFASVDYDYIMNSDGEVESVEVSCNPDWDKQEKHHDAHHIPKGWQYNKDHGKEPGGSSDVIVAVIDTGVDYNHIDLRNNIWINSGEIPGNGIDDDGNGYIDDVYGWNFVGDNNAPLDDNGHGTHVAGIIAAENNQIGGVGVAYNSKVMVLKAGNSSGYFNNSDIAEAIQYAYMNGASVINMSFCGSAISIAVEEALENAYYSCVLVAAAGNDGACNNLACPICSWKSVFYPAALPYVIGVMSTSSDCTTISSFSNYDHDPYNNIEYEVYAVGESVFSTWPNNKFATLNGTSMAAPYVSGIAALLRTAYPDRNTYSTKYLQSQIVNTGSINLDGAHSVANVYEAMTKLPTPEVNLYDYYIDDSTAISSNNNGNGVADAGETIRLFVSLQNRGGVASNVKVTLDTIRKGDPSLIDPYFTIVNDTVNLSDIGTYSVREANETQYFEIKIDSGCPNDYITNFNVKFTYTNGMDANDNTVYEDDGKQQAQFTVSKGYCLPSTFTEDTTYTADRLYIVGDDVVIPAGITVTFEEGCEIQFYDDRDYYNSPAITVYGTLNFNGTKENMIYIYPNETHPNFICFISSAGGDVYANYIDSVNLFSEYSHYIKEVKNSWLRLDYEETWPCRYSHGYVRMCSGVLYISTMKNSYVELGGSANYRVRVCENNVIDFADKGSAFFSTVGDSFVNNIVAADVVTSSGGSRQFSIGNSVFGGESIYENNYFFTTNNEINSLPYILYDHHFGWENVRFANNAFSSLYQQYASQIIDGYYDTTGNPIIDFYGDLADASLLWPYVVDVQLFNKAGEEVTTIGKEQITARVTFNRPMDTTQNTYLTFGSIEPYADYRINGKWVSDTVWEGTYTLTANIENGQNYIKVNNACAAEDPTKTVFGEYQLYEFTIDTTAALSMNLQSNLKENGIELTFVQDDYDTLLGYNIYRSESKDGKYTKLNPTILLPTENSFTDENAEPGKTYWYTYTVVLTDFSESKPAGKVTATAMDTIYPTIYHTPVNQGYQNNNLVISCTASDNVGVSLVILYYRTKGETVWKTLTMSKTNDKYSASVFGSEVTLSGIEYYIEASDGRNVIQKGSAETPYSVVVKDASSISQLGDVDGDGVVTTKDALMLMQCINGDLILSDDEFKRADLNGDGILSSYEALRILQYINGNVSTLEM